MRWLCVRTVNAPPERVFRVVGDPVEFNKAIPEGVSVEYLTSQHSGVGTRFRAVRAIRGKAQGFDQEITECVPPARIRMRNVTHGTIWDSTFYLQPTGSSTKLTLTMTADSKKLLPRLINPLIRGTIQKALEQDMDAVKTYCEK